MSDLESLHTPGIQQQSVVMTDSSAKCHATPPSIPLTYSIVSSTPHSGKYGPENIILDKPQDQGSRWSGALQGNANQWIMLRLESLAVLTTITFGKYIKAHPCNVKDLKVFVGINEDHMTEVLHAGLKNDTIPETFLLTHTNCSDVGFPTQYVKIVPIVAHGQNFHISIWHVAMTGIADPTYVERIHRMYDEFRETSVLRYVLKHLRQRRLLTPYQSILSRANIRLEHPLITQFHDSLVLHGDWSKSEDILQSMTSAGLFDAHLNSSQPRAVWTRLIGTDSDGDIPPARGGHAMCLDPVNEMIYVFGGWNGEKSLDDFWVYSIKEDRWKVLSHSTTQEPNAPGARSCHKMVFDTKNGTIYVLGRLNDEDGIRPPEPPASRAQHVSNGYLVPTQQPPATSSPSVSPTPPQPKLLTSEFYRYHTRGVLAGKWDFLSIDTASSGGPPLIFDHQMVMDSEAQMLYVFGGRVVDGDWDVSRFSELYSYNLTTSKWKLLQHPIADPLHGHQTIPSRFGHSMVLDAPTKTLYIFAGQRDNKYLSDMYTYNLNTGVGTELFNNFTTAGGPDACFTQRAIIDPELKEIYIFCGLTKTSHTSIQSTLGTHLSNWVFRYDTHPGKWMPILGRPDKEVAETPQARFAHQVVYNPKTKTIFLHGGNAGGAPPGDAGRGGRETDGDAIIVDAGENSAGTKERLDDFWRMELKRPGPQEIIRQATFQIRRQQFREMCDEEAPVKALNFLQTQVSSVVDHANAKETETFRSLLTHLLSPASHSRPPSSPVKRDESREASSRPRKRSRAERHDTGEWTSDLPQGDSHGYASDETLRLRDVVDPLESVIRGEETDSTLTGARYSQRTEVFENILKFIVDSEKQPTESLLDLVERDRCRIEMM